MPYGIKSLFLIAALTTTLMLGAEEKKQVDFNDIPLSQIREAATRAAENGKLVLLIFHAPWDAWSNSMSERIFNDSRFNDLLDMKYEIVSISVPESYSDAELDKTLDLLGVSYFPQSLVILPEGEVDKRLGCLSGGLDHYITALNGEIVEGSQDFQLIPPEGISLSRPKPLNIQIPLPTEGVDMKLFQERIGQNNNVRRQKNAILIR